MSVCREMVLIGDARQATSEGKIKIGPVESGLTGPAAAVLMYPHTSVYVILRGKLCGDYELTSRYTADSFRFVY